MKSLLAPIVASVAAALLTAAPLHAQVPQGTGWTYQGLLFEGDVAANGSFDLSFAVFDSPLLGAPPLLPAQIVPDVPVEDGRFTVQLDFGKPIFDTGEARWLEIAVSDGGPFTTLVPRQRITPTPAAIFAQNAASAKPSFRIFDPDVDPGKATLFFGLTDDCRLGTSPDVTGLTATDPAGFRVVNPLDPLGGRLLLGTSNDCQIFTSPADASGINVSDPSGLRLRNPVPGLPIRILFGPTDDCGVVVDPSGPNGLIMRDPRGVRILPPFGLDPARLRFGGTDLCEIVAGGGFSPGLNLRDPSGVRVVNPNFGGSQLAFGDTDNCTIRAGNLLVAEGMVFSDPTGFRFNGGFIGVNVPTPETGIQLPPIPGPPGSGLAFAWQTYSSRRFKENIAPLDGSLDLIDRLQAVRFDWIQDGSHDIGFIAEDVAAVVPEVVTMEPDGVNARSLDYARLTALAIEGIKAQQDQIAALKRDNGQLRAELAELRAAVESMVSARAR